MKTKMILVGSVLAITSLVASQGAEVIRTATAPSEPGISGAGGSCSPAFTADGRRVVFISTANNLVTNENKLPYLDVFVRDLVTSNTVLVSAALGGSGGANGDCNYASISQGGHFVVFASAANNLVANDTNDASDVFVWNMATRTTTQVSVDVNGNAPANPLTVLRADSPLSGNPRMSLDGYTIVFESLATNLVSLEDTNLAMDVFERDISSGVTRLVSVNAIGTGAGNGSSRLCDISKAEHYVAFTSRASDLVPGGRYGIQEVFVRDMELGITYWASSNALELYDLSPKFHSAVLSRAGELVLFKKDVYGDNSLWRYELQSGATVCIQSNGITKDLPVISPDGTVVVYGMADGLYWWDGVTNRFLCAGTTPVWSDSGLLVYKVEGSGIYARTNLVEGNAILLTLRMDGTAADFVWACLPAVSPDGRWVAYESEDTGIVTNDLNQASDIFLVDMNSGSTGIVSERHTARPAAQTGAGLALAGRGCISADGSKVIFTTMDSSFAARDTNKLQDVFVKNLQNGEVTPVSILPEIVAGPDGSGPQWITNAPFAFNLMGREPVISAGGSRAAWVWRIVRPVELAYVSLWAPHDEDVYVRDLANPTNYTLVSKTIDGSRSGNSRNPVLSRDGSMVAFEGTSSQIVNYTNVGSNTPNIYVYYVTSRTNQLVSVGNFWEGVANPLFSPDDEWVVFEGTESYTQYTQLYARNLRNQMMRLVSPEAGYALETTATGAVFSANSRYVVFSAYENRWSGSTNRVYRHDLLSNTTNVLVCEDCLNPSCSADGRFVAYESRIFITNLPVRITQIYLKDLVTGEATLVSTNRLGAGSGNANSSSPSVSYDGRYVVFASFATNLVDTPVTGTGDVYVWDRVLGTTLLASANAAGTAGGNLKSSNPIMAADGRTVVFQSFANDLGEGDYNLTRDLFVLRLAGPDSDGDGMEDGWEAAYFGDLSRDGSGDFDGDGASDLQEFLAGTDPTNQGSVLRAWTVSSISSGSVRVLWNAAPGRVYRVEYKTALTDSDWTDLAGEVVSGSTTGVAVDPTAMNGNRFYRVVLIR